MNQSSHDSNKSANELLNSLLKSNSCITLSTTKKTTAPSSESPSSKDSQKEPEAVGTPDPNETTQSKNQSEEQWLKEWTAKNRSSISFTSTSKKTAQPPTPSEESLKPQKQQTYSCHFCQKVLDSQYSLIRHITSCGKVSVSVSDKSKNPNKENEQEDTVPTVKLPKHITITSVPPNHTASSDVKSADTSVKSLPLDNTSSANVDGQGLTNSISLKKFRAAENEKTASLPLAESPVAQSSLESQQIKLPGISICTKKLVKSGVDTSHSSSQKALSKASESDESDTFSEDVLKANGNIKLHGVSLCVKKSGPPTNSNEPTPQSKPSNSVETDISSKHFSVTHSNLKLLGVSISSKKSGPCKNDTPHSEVPFNRSESVESKTDSESSLPIDANIKLPGASICPKKRAPQKFDKNSNRSNSVESETDSEGSLGALISAKKQVTSTLAKTLHSQSPSIDSGTASEDSSTTITANSVQGSNPKTRRRKREVSPTTPQEFSRKNSRRKKKKKSTPAWIKESAESPADRILELIQKGKEANSVNVDNGSNADREPKQKLKFKFKASKPQTTKLKSRSSSPSDDSNALNLPTQNSDIKPAVCDPLYSVSHSESDAASGLVKSFIVRRERRIPENRKCIPCNIGNLGSAHEFEFHHLQHIIDKKVRVRLRRSSTTPIPNSGSNTPDQSQDEDSKPCFEDLPISPQESTESVDLIESIKHTVVPEPMVTIPVNIELPEPMVTFPVNLEEPPLKLKLKITKGKKRKTVRIVNSEDMNPTPPETPVSWDAQASFDSELSEDIANETLPSPNPPPEASPSPIENDNQQIAVPTPPSSFPGSAEGFGEIPGSSYEPQFESYTGDWMQEYESGSRIAAAMTGTPEHDGVPSNLQNNMPTLPDSGPNSTTSDGLFSQEILGSSPNYGPALDPANIADPPQDQGSFEQFCLNDPYAQDASQLNINNASQLNINNASQLNINNGAQLSQQSFNQNISGNNVLTQLDYMSNNVAPMNAPAMTIRHDEDSNFNSSPLLNPPTFHPMSNSNSPLAGSLAPSPTNMYASSQIRQATPPVASGQTPPLPAQPFSATSTQEITTPRLTIANNLMATTASSVINQRPNNFNPRWSANNTQSFNSNFANNSQMAPPMRRAMPRLPMAYRPSPRPRIRGRPPLIDQMVRPMRPPQRMSFSPRGRGMIRGTPHRGVNPQNLKRSMPSQGTSPNKVARREDINVPSRQKDTDCQIIAVANRNEGMPTIANIQGGTPNTPKAPDPTIHLSDSITLSVRPNATPSDPRRSDKDTGGVANLLASRGITVTPAAGEKEAAATSAREERRLPSASDLNLSSAISVHPPTSRDRDGFAVPLPPAKPSSSSPVNTQADRPPRPPTVDLTYDLSATGSGATRAKCSQCDRSFPNQALLADHAKVHQQQSQSRMSFKCHLCTAGFSSQKGQQQHYQQFHQLQLSAGDLGIPIVDLRNPNNIQKMQRLGVRAFLPLNNLQNRGAGGVVGIPILSLENIANGTMSLQQWGINDVLSLGPPKTINMPR